MNDDNGFSSILASFVAGGLAGVTLALLLAPQSRRRTRGLISQRLRDRVERGRRARARAAGKGRDVLEARADDPGHQREDPRGERHVSVAAGRLREEGPAL